MSKEFKDKEKELDDIKNQILDIKLALYQTVLEKITNDVSQYYHILDRNKAFKEDKEENLNNYLYDGVSIEELKPYVLVVGAIGSGKTTYINGAKMWDHKRKYFSIGDLTHVNKAVRKHADQIIKVEILKLNEEDTIKYE